MYYGYDATTPGWKESKDLEQPECAARAFAENSDGDSLRAATAASNQAAPLGQGRQAARTARRPAYFSTLARSFR